MQSGRVDAHLFIVERRDAVCLTCVNLGHLLNLDKEHVSTNQVGEALGWAPRRLNPTAAYLVAARVVEGDEYFGSGDHYWPPGLTMSDELLRFVSSL